MPPSIGAADGFVSQTRPVSAIRVGRKKLLYFWEDGRTELYDLDGDPAESRELEAGKQELADRLFRALDAAGARKPVAREPL